MRETHALADVAAAGREIGRGLAPDPGAGDARTAMHDALSALGFAPRDESPGPHRFRYVLTNCPYRDAVAENAAVVCTLHRGITQGLLDRIDPESRVTAFVPHDPFTAGCVIEAGTG
jgi:predicted ArsR family transcriptional regulator